MSISPMRAGIALAALAAAVHTLWAALVAAGWAQAVIDFILHLHFIRLAATVEPFNATLAAALIAVTSFAGFVVGVVLASFWNWLQKRPVSGGAARITV